VYWHCTGQESFADVKAAADAILSARWPFEPYDTDAFRRDADGHLWDSKRGVMRRGQSWKPAASLLDAGYGEGDELVCMVHLHKYWVKTCNSFSESRAATSASVRAARAQAVRDEIIAQAGRQVCERTVKRPTGTTASFDEKAKIAKAVKKAAAKKAKKSAAAAAAAKGGSAGAPAAAAAAKEGSAGAAAAAAAAGAAPPPKKTPLASTKSSTSTSLGGTAARAAREAGTGAPR
jgi:hypothetical protein